MTACNKDYEGKYSDLKQTSFWRHTLNIVESKGLDGNLIKE